MTVAARRTPALIAAATLCAAALATGASAQTSPTAPAKPAAKVAKAKRPAPARAPVILNIPDASPEQQKAAEMVYYGNYACEFNQTVDIALSPKHAGYVDVKHGRGAWLMRPVLSSTGAVRLEDVLAETLMVQIASKSMLLNTKTGRRIVDDCVSPKQRELIESARAEAAARAAEEAARGGAVATSTPAPAGLLR